MFSKTHQTGTTHCPPCFYELHSHWGTVLNLFHFTRTVGSQLSSPRYITNIISKKVLIFNMAISTTSVGRNPTNVIRTAKSSSGRDYTWLNINRQLKGWRRTQAEEYYNWLQIIPTGQIGIISESLCLAQIFHREQWGKVIPQSSSE